MKIKFILDLIFEQITNFGGIIFYGFVLGVLFVFFIWDLLISLFISLLLIMITAILMKHFFFKERPNKQKGKNFIEKIDASSFPSVHSMRIFSLIFWFSLFYKNPIFIFYISFFGLLVMYSRIYLKKHYLLDVFFGCIFSLLINLAILWFI